MQRYWRGNTKNGKFSSEALGSKWENDELQSLELTIEDKDITIKLPDNMEYVQSKTASADLASGKVEVESRNVGFKIGNKIVTIRVSESTSDINVEVS